MRCSQVAHDLIFMLYISLERVHLGSSNEMYVLFTESLQVFF